MTSRRSREFRKESRSRVRAGKVELALPVFSETLSVALPARVS